MSLEAHKIVLAVRQGSLEEAVRALARLTLEQVKPIARDICGLKKIHPTADSAAQAKSLKDQILKVLQAQHKLRPSLARLGDVITDEDSGEQVQITEELLQLDIEIQHRLEQAEFSVQRGMVDICKALKEFKECRVYLAHGCTSFKQFCNMGKLHVLGQARSYAYAQRCIQLVGRFGEEVVARVRPLTQRDLQKFISAFSADDMGPTLAELKQNFQLTYTGADGTEKTLRLPKSGADINEWREFLDVMGNRTAQARRESRDAEDTLVSERETWLGERQALLEQIGQLEGEMRAAAGRGEEALEELESLDNPTPEQIVQLQKSVRESRQSLRRLSGELQDAQHRAEEIGAQLDKRRKLALEEGTLKKALQFCQQAERLGEQAIDALSPLRALGLDLPQGSLDLLHDTAVRLESQFRGLADDCTGWRKEKSA